MKKTKAGRELSLSIEATKLMIKIMDIYDYDVLLNNMAWMQWIIYSQGQQKEN